MAQDPENHGLSAEKNELVFDLFFDESGRFVETSTDRGDRLEHGDERIFASQLAGVLVSDDGRSWELAREILDSALAEAGFDDVTGADCHGVELKMRAGYDALLVGVANRVALSSWQAVRMVNRERVRAGDRKANYLNMVANLVVQLLGDLASKFEGKILLRLFPAVVVRGEAGKSLHENMLAHEEDYELCVRDALMFLSLRAGGDDVVSRCSVKLGGLHSARKEDRLKVCDLLSHGSHDNYKGRAKETARALKVAFGEYDYSLAVPHFPNQVRELIDAQALGLAGRVLTEAHLEGRIGDRAKLEALRIELVGALAGLDVGTRNRHLSILLQWIEEIVEDQGEYARGRLAANWITNATAFPLESSLKEGRAEIAWFVFAMQHFVLIANGSLQDLLSAEVACCAMETRTPRLRSQPEFSSLLLRGIVSASVHRSACFDCDFAFNHLAVVVAHYDAESQDLGDGPSVLANALHAWVGALIRRDRFESLDDVQEGRHLSDRAISAYEGEPEVAKQHLQRCHLEALIGNFHDARVHLAASLGLKKSGHAAMCRRILKSVGAWQSELLYSYLRMIGLAYRLGYPEQFDLGWHALGESELLSRLPEEYAGWEDFRLGRCAAFAVAASGDLAQAHEKLGKLRSSFADKAIAENLLLATVVAASLLEVAGLSWIEDEEFALKLIDDERGEFLGAVQVIRDIVNLTESDFPQMCETFKRWQKKLGEVLVGECAVPSHELLLLSADVGI